MPMLPSRCGSLILHYRGPTAAGAKIAHCCDGPFPRWCVLPGMEGTPRMLRSLRCLATLRSVRFVGSRHCSRDSASFRHKAVRCTGLLRRSCAMSGMLSAGHTAIRLRFPAGCFRWRAFTISLWTCLRSIGCLMHLRTCALMRTPLPASRPA